MLGRYYEACVIGGADAFFVVVKKADDFESALRRKLVREIAGAGPSLVPVALNVSFRPNCSAMAQYSDP